MDVHSIEKRLVEFLSSVTGHPRLSAEADLLESGLADSLTMMDLLVFIETEYQLRLDFTDLNPTVFRTPATIARFICDRQTTIPQNRAA